MTGKTALEYIESLNVAGTSFEEPRVIDADIWDAAHEYLLAFCRVNLYPSVAKKIQYRGEWYAKEASP